MLAWDTHIHLHVNYSTHTHYEITYTYKQIYTIPLEIELAGRTLFPLVLCIASRITICLPYSPTFIEQKHSYIHVLTCIYMYIQTYMYICTCRHQNNIWTSINFCAFSYYDQMKKWSVGVTRYSTCVCTVLLVVSVSLHPE